MADVKTSNMSAAAALTGAELVPGVQSGSNVKITTAKLSSLVDRGTFTYSATPTLDVTTNANWDLTNDLTGNMAVTLSNGAGQIAGSIRVRQDATGGRTFSLTATGATMVNLGGAISSTADAYSYIAYEFATVDGVLVCYYSMSPGLGDISATSITLNPSGLHLLDTNSSHDLIINPGSDLTADRTLTLTTGDANRTLTLGGDFTANGGTVSSGTHSGTNTGDALSEDSFRIARSSAPTGANTISVSGRAYAWYMGYYAQAKVWKFVRVNVSTVAAGTQTAEVALATTPAAPTYGTSQTFTFRTSDGTLDDLTTGTGMKKNTTAFNSGSGYTMAAGSHVWAVARFAMGTTQPTFITGSPIDANDTVAMVSNDDSIGALTSATTYTFRTLSAASLNRIAYMWLTMD